jgi:hypothetical protein
MFSRSFPVLPAAAPKSGMDLLLEIVKFYGRSVGATRAHGRGLSRSATEPALGRESHRHLGVTARPRTSGRRHHLAMKPNLLTMASKNFTRPVRMVATPSHSLVSCRSSRTVALLTERLDQHRGRGQQQITVKHVTVNADQAVVADQIVTDKERRPSLQNCSRLGPTTR